MSPRLTRPGFSAARHVQELGAKIDDFLLRNRPTLEREPNSLYAIEARTAVPLQPGMLVQAISGGQVTRADRTSGVAAVGVVLKTIGRDRVIWSPDALVYVKVADTRGTQYKELWLDNTGAITATQPTAGMIQRVGVSLFYDRALGKHFCRIDPSPPTSNANCFWVYNADNEICIDTVNRWIQFTVGGNVAARLRASDGRLLLKGTLRELDYTTETEQLPYTTPDGMIEYNSINTSISFGVKNAALTKVIQVAELNSAGRLTVGRAIEMTTFPLTISPAMANYYAWNGGVGALDISYEKTKIYARFERIISSGVTNAKFNVNTIQELAAI